MRSEHRATGDENDMNWKSWDRIKSGAHNVYVYVGMNRPGIRKRIKRTSHKIDRQRARRALGMGDEP